MSKLREVCIEEGSILGLISEYFEGAGHAECLLALEKVCTGPCDHQVPVELAALREMVLNGNWDLVMQYLDMFNKAGDKEGLKRCRYHAQKQRFLETLHHVETNIKTKIRLGYCPKNDDFLTEDEAKKFHQTMETQLKALKSLCPSPEDHKSLKTLVSIPAISSSEQFASWQVQSGRLDTLYHIQDWISKVLCFSRARFSSQKAGKKKRASKSSHLLRLLAKGLLYEQCEMLCQRRSGSEVLKDASIMLDLKGWLQQQPDSSFQLPPTKIRLVVNPWSKSKAKTPATGEKASDNTKPSPQQNSPGAKSSSGCVATEPAAPQLTGEAPTAQETEATVKVSEKGGQKEKHKDSSPTSPAGAKESSTSHQPPRSPEKPAAATQVSVHKHIEPSSSSKERDTPNTGTEQPLADTTPLQKRTRLSSTPKNVQDAESCLRASPPSSPIVTTPNAKRAAEGPEQEKSLPRVDRATRKHINFNEDTRVTKRRTQQWPAVSLLGRITDSQAVRSVAFSGSGQYVAVGANSGTLRVCETAAFLSGHKPNEELEMLLEESRCHRGSIYCLDWYKDKLLASGSNDRHISLLNWSLDDPKAHKSPPHKGTIRDLLFTPEELLVYAGGTYPEVMVTDVQTFKNIVSLTGHKEQVLALEVLPGGCLASAGQDHTVLLWDMRSKDPISHLELEQSVASLTSSGNHLVTSHLDGSCAVFDLNSFKRVSEYKAHSKECRSVRYYPKGDLEKDWVLSGSYDKTICLTNTSNLQWTKLCQHQDKVIQCRWHPQGQVFASTGADKQACFWKIDMKSS